MVDTCIALFKKEKEEELYKSYITTCLRILTENSAKLVNVASQGTLEASFMSADYLELLRPETIKQERTGDEIVEDVLCQLGLEVRQ